MMQFYKINKKRKRRGIIDDNCSRFISPVNERCWLWTHILTVQHICCVETGSKIFFLMFLVFQELTMFEKSDICNHHFFFLSWWRCFVQIYQNYEVPLFSVSYLLLYRSFTELKEQICEQIFCNHSWCSGKHRKVQDGHSHRPQLSWHGEMI